MYGCGMELITIGLAAFATSILSALAGLGGGIVLLVVLTQFFTPTVAIPIHGSIQLVSNGSRAAMLVDKIKWSAVGWSAILLLPASLVGVAVATAMPEAATRLLIGLFVLVVAWKPSLLKWRGADQLPDKALIGVGGVSGFLNTTVGASGPVTSPFFKAATATHVAFVATAGAAQVLAHASKIVAFSLDDFAIGDHLGVIGTGAIAVTLGSFVGTRLLGRVSDAHLDTLFKVVLTVLAVRLIGRALLSF